MTTFQEYILNTYKNDKIYFFSNLYHYSVKNGGFIKFSDFYQDILQDFYENKYNALLEIINNYFIIPTDTEIFLDKCIIYKICENYNTEKTKNFIENYSKMVDYYKEFKDNNE